MISSEEQFVSSQELESSLYTINTESTEVDFDIMMPYVFFFKEENFSKVCFNFRNECLRQELVFEKLPVIKKMAINHVYLVEHDPINSVIHVQNDFFVQFGLNEAYPVLMKEDIDAIINISQNLNVNDKENAMNTALQHLIKHNNNPVAKIMYNL
ncbi:uncharacterized protein BX663DRAFT_506470 [Cokeromyces recurvatus]|uniref:uncharacterized protein n=1 Tax=Cokeromyces recurvatus TaxID=90255 RepID=UPI00221FD20C|nr:uncharacterized protein BX663DRAFT_506470 [Cokeromyces recurvatus]KAI7903426.1 hypothetical protein BX663DRAFT_506470 [Cokeromyces recurvatus]